MATTPILRISASEFLNSAGVVVLLVPTTIFLLAISGVGPTALSTGWPLPAFSLVLGTVFLLWRDTLLVCAERRVITRRRGFWPFQNQSELPFDILLGLELGAFRGRGEPFFSIWLKFRDPNRRSVRLQVYGTDTEAVAKGQDIAERLGLPLTKNLQFDHYASPSGQEALEAALAALGDKDTKDIPTS